MGESNLVEVYFLRYAFPCAFIIKDKKEIDEKTFNQLEEAAIKKKKIKREILEKIFFRAFDRIKKLAQERKKDKWNFEVIKEYFLKKHNEDIEQGIGIYAHVGETLKEFSKVFKAKIVDKKDNALVVEYNNKQRTVLNIFVPEAEVGDMVTIHYGYAVEIVG